MMVTIKKVLIYAIYDDPKIGNKKVGILGEIQFLRYDVTK
jgi:hypothetical protein